MNQIFKRKDGITMMKIVLLTDAEKIKEGLRSLTDEFIYVSIE